MSTELKSNTKGVSLTRFWGGDDRGVCVQMTARKRELPAVSDKFFDSMQLTKEQATALALDLLDFAAGREQALTDLEAHEQVVKDHLAQIKNG